MTRLEPYDTEAAGARVRSIGIDVQKDRIEISVYDIGLGEEMWAIDHLIVTGDTAGPEPWAELAAEIEAIGPDCGGIDSGYNADQAVAFAARRPWLYVLKGMEGRGKTLVESDDERKRRLRKRRKKGFSPFLVADEAAKALITQRLKLEPGAEGMPRAGYLHYPANEPAFDDEFFAQLTSNRLVEKTHRGRLLREWVQTRVRNEAYDCWKYALAGFRLSKIDPARRAKFAARIAEEYSDAATMPPDADDPLTRPVRPRARGSFAKTW
jgi:phage terminase large subunit GpA-like protein